MTVEQIITLDVTKQSCRQLVFGAKAGEGMVRRLTVILTNGSKKLLLPSGTHAEIYLTRPDGISLHGTCHVDAIYGRISHVLTSQETLVAGRVECEMRIQMPSDSEGNIPVMYTPCFDLIVESSAYTENSVVSENENSEWSSTLERIRALEEISRPEPILLKWHDEPSAAEISEEAEKLQLIVSEWEEDPSLCKIDVRVIYEGTVCPASVSVFESDSCYIYFSDAVSREFFEIRYVTDAETPLQYLKKNWAQKVLIASSDAIPTSKAVADWVRAYVDSRIGNS